MTDYAHYEAVLAVIERGIDAARQNPKAGEPVAADDYIAWCVLRELHRSGWSMERNSN